MAPAQAETTAQLVKKEKSFKKNVDPWLWNPFPNPARTDALLLKHWTKEKERDEVYPFGRFNRKLEVINYTPQEYEEVIASLSSDWNREETDHLFDLCEQYSLRFIIIADRFDNSLSQSPMTNGKKRELKAKDKENRKAGK